MSKRQIWLTAEECDLANRIFDFAKERMDDRLGKSFIDPIDGVALKWTRISVARLAAKFALPKAVIPIKTATEEEPAND